MVHEKPQKKQFKTVPTKNVALLHLKKTQSRVLGCSYKYLWGWEKADLEVYYKIEKVIQSHDQQIKIPQAYIDMQQHKNNKFYGRTFKNHLSQTVY